MIQFLAQAQQSTGINLPSISNLDNLLNQGKTWLMENGLTLVSNLIAAIIVYIVGRWVAVWLKKLVIKLSNKSSVDQTLGNYLGNIVYAIIMIMVLIAALGKLGVPTAQFAAIIAAAGLAIGLALQGNLSNFASGFMLIFFRPVKVGDYIVAGGAEGNIDEIGIFTTVLNTLDNKKVIVPNSSITGGNIVNLSANEHRLVAIPVSVSPSNDSKAVEKALLEATQGNAYVVNNIAPVAVITELGEGKFIMELRAWCKSSDYWSALFTLNDSVKKSIEANQIIPFLPHQAIKVLKD